MLRLPMTVRPDLDAIAEHYGFSFHIIDDEIYWDESRAYRFTLKQIEEGIEQPTEELHEMCLDLVDRAVRSESMMKALAIPPLYWDAIAQSWFDRDPSLYGRMDFSWDGRGPVKLLEYNADTPTSLYESAFFQWQWLEDARRLGKIPRDADQFNSIQEKLIARFGQLQTQDPFYFCCNQDSGEDRGTVLYLEDCARQAGLDTRFLFVEELGLGTGGVLTDLQDRVIHQLFKLYPLEWMMRDDYGPLLPARRERWVEPLWKAVLSNKGILPFLWQTHRGHPNLLPAYFACDLAQARESIAQDMGDQSKGLVKKPLFSREGANVTIYCSQSGNHIIDQEAGMYGDEPVVYQAFSALPRFGDSFTMLGSWIVGDEAAGIGIREDISLITKDTSRFIPHFIS